MADVAELGIRVNASGAVQELGNFERGAERASSAGEKLVSTTESLKRMLEGLGVALGAIELLRLSNEARESAEQLNITNAALQQMGVTAGITNEQMVSTIRSLENMGTTIENSRGDVVKLINAHIDLKNAVALQAEAQNLAIKEHIDEKEALDNLVLAIQTGMARTLRHAGIVADFTRAEKEAANSLGVHTDQLSVQQVEQIRLNEVLKSGAAIQGVYSAALQTSGGQAIVMHKALADLRVAAGEVFAELTEPAVLKLSAAFQSLAKYVKENPKALTDIRDLIVSMTQAVGVAVGVWTAWQLVIAATGAKLAIVAAIDTIRAFLELAKSVETAADAFALLGIAAEAVNPIALIAGVAAMTAAFFAWKKLTQSTKDDTEEFGKQLNELGETIKTTGGKVTQGNDGLQSSQAALEKLLTMRREIPALVAGLANIGDAYITSGKGAGDLAQRSAELNDAIAKETVGLVGNDAAQMRALVSRKYAAQWYAEDAKSLRDVVDAGQDQLRTAEQQAITSHLVGDAARTASIEFEHQNAVIKAQRDLFGDAQAAAIQYADRARDAQLKAAAEIQRTQPFQDMLASAQDDFGAFFSALVTDGTGAFTSLADSIRRIFASLLSDLAKMMFEKKIAPQLAGMLGLGQLSAKDAAQVVAMQNANDNVFGSNALGLQLPAVTSTAKGSTLGTIGTVGGIGLAGLSLAYGLGNAAPNSSTAALGGAASGAAAGAAIGTIVPVIGTAVGAVVGGLAGLVTGLFGQASKIKEARKAVEDAEGQFIDKLKTYPSQYSQSFQDISKSFQDLQDAAAKAHIGISAEAVAAQTNAKLAIKNSFLTDLGQQLNAVSGSAGAFSNQLDAINQKYVSNVATARDLGLGEGALDEAEQIRIRSIQELIKAEANLDNVTQNLMSRMFSLTGGHDIGTDPFASIEKAIADALANGQTDLAESLKQELGLDKQFNAYLDGIQAQKEAAAAQAGIEQANKQLLQAQLATQQKLLDSSNAQLTTVQQQVTDTQKVVDSLRAFQDSFKLNPQLSILSPRQQLTEAAAQFHDLVAKAAGGDATAASAVTGAAQTYAQIGKSYYGSSLGYVGVYNDIQGGVGSVQAVFGQQLTTEQLMLKELQTSNNVLKAQSKILQDQLDAIDANTGQQEIQALIAKVNYERQLPASNVAGGPVPQIQYDSALLSYALIYGSVTAAQKVLQQAYAGQASNLATGQNMYLGNTPAAQATNVANGWYWDPDSQTWKNPDPYATPISGFATGGDHRGGWRVVGEHGRELELTGASRIMTPSQIAGGGAEVVGAIRSLERKYDLMLDEMRNQTRAMRVSRPRVKSNR